MSIQVNLIFVIVKIFNAVKQKITLFEYYLSLFVIIILGFLRLLTIGASVNNAVLAISILVILYSVGIIPSVDRISKSKNL